MIHDSAATHPGGRPANEDACLARADLGVGAVADGAGGHASGAAASAAVIAALADIPPALSAAELLAQVRLRLDAVHAQLLARGAAQDGMMASTVVVLIIRGDHFACLWAGDSRAYLLRNGTLSQISQDHSLVQQMIDAGELDAAEAERHPQRHVVTRALGGGDQPLELQKVSGTVIPCDAFLLCSDGLSKEVPAPGLTQRLLAGDTAGGLVQAAVECGASDNVTAVVVTVEAAG
jgi:serine/threonine protein phosphatase PrpC